MTDREMLEFAAKAAGIDANAPVYIPGATQPYPQGAGRPWDPLTDDGDAFRLAVRLRMMTTFRQWGIGTPAGPKLMAVARTANLYADALAKHWADDNEAMRRAIVACAAEIGRGME